MTTEGSIRPTSPAAPPAVELRSITVAFGGLLALHGIDLTSSRGDRLAVLGPNGAGKTTLFNVIAGDVHPTHGTVTSTHVTAPTHRHDCDPRSGSSRTYQKTRLFGGLSVREQPVPRADRQAAPPLVDAPDRARRGTVRHRP